MTEKEIGWYCIHILDSGVFRLISNKYWYMIVPEVSEQSVLSKLVGIPSSAKRPLLKVDISMGWMELVPKELTYWHLRWGVGALPIAYITNLGWNALPNGAIIPSLWDFFLGYISFLSSSISGGNIFCIFLEDGPPSLLSQLHLLLVSPLYHHHAQTLSTSWVCPQHKKLYLGFCS